MSIDSNIEHLLAVTLPYHYGPPTRRNQKVRQQEGVQHSTHRPSFYPRFPLPLVAEVVVVAAAVAVVAAVAAAVAAVAAVEEVEVDVVADVVVAVVVDEGVIIEIGQMKQICQIAVPV